MPAPNGGIRTTRQSMEQKRKKKRPTLGKSLRARVTLSESDTSLGDIGSMERVFRTARGNVPATAAPVTQVQTNNASAELGLQDILRILGCDEETLRRAIIISGAEKLKANSTRVGQPDAAGSADILLTREQKTRMAVYQQDVQVWKSRRSARQRVLQTLAGDTYTPSTPILLAKPKSSR
jgi:hypothetical protein